MRLKLPAPKLSQASERLNLGLFAGRIHLPAGLSLMPRCAMRRFQLPGAPEPGCHEAFAACTRRLNKRASSGHRVLLFAKMILHSASSRRLWAKALLRCPRGWLPGSCLLGFLRAGSVATLFAQGASQLPSTVDLACCSHVQRCFSRVRRLVTASFVAGTQGCGDLSC